MLKKYYILKKKTLTPSSQTLYSFTLQLTFLEEREKDDGGSDLIELKI
jgi:hypothetical protein